MKRKSRVGLKTISLLLAIAFSLSDVSYAALDFKAADLPFFKKDLPGLDIPQSVAHIEEKFKGSGDKTVIVFEDAHTNESAQLNLSKALDRVL